MPRTATTLAWAIPAAPCDVVAAAASGVGLLNVYSTRNLGDAAIMASIARLSGGDVFAAVPSDANPVDIPGLVLREASTGKRFVSVGGDIFNNSRPWFVTRSFLRNVAELHRHCDRSIVFGQTIPSSCRGLSLRMLSAVLRRTGAVVVRDRQSQALLRANGVTADLSYDAAFVLQPSQQAMQAGRNAFDAAGLDPSRTVLISVRPFDALYPQDSVRFLEDATRLANRLSDRGHQVALLVQSAANPYDSDRAICEFIQGRAPGARILDMFSGPDEACPLDRLSGVMALANGVAAVRYHAAVLRLAGGRMPYHLYYSRKGEDLHHRLALTGAPLQNFDLDEAVAGIEASADRNFDPRPQAHDVEQAFARAMGRLS